MILRFVMQEKGEGTKELKFSGDYEIRDLEDVYKRLLDSKSEWLVFQSPPNGFITRKEYVKSVFLEEGQTA
jgi:hypothetical protein